MEKIRLDKHGSSLKPAEAMIVRPNSTLAPSLMADWRNILAVPDGKRAVALPPIHLSLRYRVPAEVQLPVESAVGHVGAGHVLERLVADDVDDGTHHRFPASISRRKTLG